MKHDSFVHVMKLLNFKNYKNPPNRVNPDCDSLWKIGNIFYCLNNVDYTL